MNVSLAANWSTGFDVGLWPAAVVDRRRRHDSYRGIAVVGSANLNGGNGSPAAGQGMEKTSIQCPSLPDSGSRPTRSPRYNSPDNDVEEKTS